MVKSDEHNEWIHNLLIVEKPDSLVKFCIDPQ